MSELRHTRALIRGSPLARPSSATIATRDSARARARFIDHISKYQTPLFAVMTFSRSYYATKVNGLT